MKLKRLLILPLSALLIGCGGGYSTDVDVPAGGDKIVIDPEDSDSQQAAAADVKSILTAVLSTPTFSGVGGYTVNVHLDTEFGMVVSHDSYSSEEYSYESTVWTDLSLKGDLAISAYAASNTSKYLRVKASNFSVGAKITSSYVAKQGTTTYKESGVVFNDTFKGLNLAIDYIYNEGASDFYVDLSDASIAQIPTKIRNSVISSIQKGDYGSKEAKEQVLAQAKAIFDRIDQLVVTYGKTHFTASELSGLIDLAKPSEEVSAVIKGLLDGDLLANASAYIGNLINEKVPDLEMVLNFGAAFIISKKETTLVDYSKDNFTSYGFATTFNKDEIVGIASLISQEEIEMETASIGIAVVASNENPFGEMRLSLLDLKANLEVEDEFYFQGEVELTLSYEAFVPLTAEQIAEYKSGMELVNAIQSLVPNY